MRLLNYLLLPLLLFFFNAMPLYADMALLLHQPYSVFGYFAPTGHAAIYLSRVCTESPVKLRRCNDGEHGVVISRYKGISRYDWIAIPLIPFIYAVDYPEQVPDSIDRAGVNELRNTWRREYMLDILPDASNSSVPENSPIMKGNWTELVGAAYDRKIYGFIIETEESADDALIEILNSSANKRRFNMLFRNCADFAKDIINFYYPKSVRRNLIADGGITTPKQVSKSLFGFSRRNPDLRFFTFQIPQVRGDLARSTAVRGVFESIVMSKKYAIPLAIVSPWVAVGGLAAYLTEGRFNPEKHALTVLEPGDLLERFTEFYEYPPE